MPPLRPPLLLARRTFTHHPSRPRLPHLLLRPSLLPPPPPPHSPPRRLISAQTKAYLIRESLIAARIVTYGYSLLFVGGLLATTAALIATEQSHPTPPTLPWRTRTALTLSRAIAAWTGHRPAATVVLRSALEELELAPQRRSAAWRLAHQQTLGQLAEFAELAEDPSGAWELWQRLADTPTATADARVAAGLRVAKLAEFQRDDAAAEAALLGAVAAGEKAGGTALVTALTEMAVFQACKRGDRFAALELLTRVLATRRAAGRPVDPGSAEAASMVADPCAEAATMTYIGEILFALGERREGVAWSKQAFSQSAELAELRGKCKECAIVAGTNLSAMAALMEAEAAAAEGEKGRAGWFSGFFGKTETEPAESVHKWDEAVRELEQIRASKSP